MIARLVVLVLLALAPGRLAWAQASVADDQALAEAKRHFEAGKNAYTAGDYQAAIREFKAAEALRPSAVLAYNIGLANEKLGKRRVAVKYFRRYLDGAPTAPNRGEVEGKIAQLERDIAANPTGPQATQQQPERASDMPPEQPPPPTANAGYDPYGQPPAQVPAKQKKSLWWVWVLVGVGSAALLGIIIGVSVWALRQDTYPYDGSYAIGQSLTSPPPTGPAGAHKAPDTANLTIRF